MICNYFGKRILIPDNLITKYEEKVGFFTNNTVNFYGIVLNLNQGQSEQELEKCIINAMEDDCRDSVCVKELLLMRFKDGGYQ